MLTWKSPDWVYQFINQILIIQICGQAEKCLICVDVYHYLQGS